MGEVPFEVRRLRRRRRAAAHRSRPRRSQRHRPPTTPNDRGRPPAPSRPGCGPPGVPSAPVAVGPGCGRPGVPSGCGCTPVRVRDLSSGFAGGPSSAVAAPGCCLVASAPGGPVRRPGHGHSRWDQEDGEQVADFRGGRRDRFATAGGVVRIGGPVGSRAGCDGGPGTPGRPAGVSARTPGASLVDPDPGGAGHGQDVAGAAALRTGTQVRVLAAGFVAGHPGSGDARFQRGGGHLPGGGAGLGRQLHLVGYPGSAAALRITAPGMLGKAEPTAGQSPSPVGGVGGEHPCPAVLDASRGAGVLPLHPAEARPFCRKPVSPTRAPPSLPGCPMAQVRTSSRGGIRVPTGVAQQVLHRPGPGTAGLSGRPAAVLPPGTRQQPGQVGAGGRPGLHSPGPARDPGHDRVGHRPPAGRGDAMARGHRTIFRSPHNPR